MTLESGAPDRAALATICAGKKEISPTGSLMKVIVDVGFEIVALVTHQAVTDMHLFPGVEVFAVFKLQFTLSPTV